VDDFDVRVIYLLIIVKHNAPSVNDRMDFEVRTAYQKETNRPLTNRDLAICLDNPKLARPRKE
jgi:hypothetical protein